MKTKNLFWLSAALLMAACTNEEDISMASSSAIQFNAAISESRVIGNTWEKGDEVGISMSAGGSMTNNVLYTAKDASGTFQTDGTALRFPDESPSDVTFYAYYPYSSTLAEDKTLTFDVDGKTDVLWTSKTVSVKSQSSNTVQLGFSHALSKVILQADGFPEDIEVTLSESCSQATLDITTGTVTPGTAETGYSVNLVKGEDGNYSAIVLPCTTTEKTLTIASATLEKQWTYTIASATYAGGQQYAYKATYKNAEGVQFTENGINVWGGDTANPEDLGDGTESVRPMSIAELLAGKTYVPDMSYFFDRLKKKDDGTYELGNSYGQSNFGENIGSVYGLWSQVMHDGCEISSITFYYGEGGKLMARSENAVGPDYDTTESITDIEVTVDDVNKTLAFSEEPFDYTWVFSDFKNKSEDTSWRLFAMESAGHFIFNDDITDNKDLFNDNKMHWAFYNNVDGNMVVVNFVEDTSTTTGE
ncbi:fimbrillin family protein [Phocaeicola plebeius]|uniref:fimbrillin family protein n=1 Tax=Phocaeicola plebeius TaxID=310297 RepID=UPI0026EA6648|nr:fimbrillin family protein [Phocaeicola plebeius]